jgi:hypothetical protein
MRYLKMAALAVLAAVAMTTVAATGSASATVYCSTTADPCPTAQKWFSLLNFRMAADATAVHLRDTSGNELDSCAESVINGTITNAGSSTSTTTASVEELTWSSCTFPTKTLAAGKLETHKIAGTSNGTVTLDGTTEVTINTVLFGSCIYGGAAGTDAGVTTEGKPPVFHPNTVTKRKGTNFACPETAVWTGTYSLTSPAGTTLSVSNS